MPHYLVQASYNNSAIQAFTQHPQDRVQVVRNMIEHFGGKLETFYFSMGDHDIVAIAELPNDVTATAMSLAVQTAGHLRHYATTKLLTEEEMMEAMTKSHGLHYPAPSRD